MWLQRRRPELFAATHKFVMANGYVNYRLTGRLAIDHSHSPLLLLADAATCEWSEELLQAARCHARSSPTSGRPRDSRRAHSRRCGRTRGCARCTGANRDRGHARGSPGHGDHRPRPGIRVDGHGQQRRCLHARAGLRSAAGVVAAHAARDVAGDRRHDVHRRIAQMVQEPGLPGERVDATGRSLRRLDSRGGQVECREPGRHLLAVPNGRADADLGQRAHVGVRRTRARHEPGRVGAGHPGGRGLWRAAQPGHVRGQWPAGRGSAHPGRRGQERRVDANHLRRPRPAGPGAAGFRGRRRWAMLRWRAWQRVSSPTQPPRSQPAPPRAPVHRPDPVAVARYDRLYPIYRAVYEQLRPSFRALADFRREFPTDTEPS